MDYSKSSFSGILRLEGFFVFLSMVILYQKMMGVSWKQFAILFFLPDISLVGYLFGKKTGAIFYNIGHSYVFPLTAGLVFWALGLEHLLFLILIWVAHIGFDRALGFGLKSLEGFEYTHLGIIKFFKK